VQIISNHFAQGFNDASSMFKASCNDEADICNTDDPATQLTTIHAEEPLIADLEVYGVPPNATYEFYITSGIEAPTTAKIIWRDMVTCTGAPPFLFQRILFFPSVCLFLALLKKDVTSTAKF
jgi:hypothetical protein